MGCLLIYIEIYILSAMSIWIAIRVIDGLLLGESALEQFRQLKIRRRKD